MKKEETIHFIITGGTIDSHFDPTKDTVVIGNETSVEAYVSKLKLHNPTKFEVVTLKDSREIKDTDRQKILETIKKSPNRMIIITHGTYTMPDTGRYLKDKLNGNKKTIVLVGSMIPLKGFEFSDAPFNLGYAIAKVQDLKSGVYICMNGQVFDPDKVHKNKVEGRFERSRSTHKG